MEPLELERPFVGVNSPDRPDNPPQGKLTTSLAGATADPENDTELWTTRHTSRENPCYIKELIRWI